MSDPRSELRSWIAEVLKRHGGLHPVTFRLRHIRGDQSVQPVDELTVSKEEPKTPEEIEAFLGQTSARDATVLRGTQRYGVFLYVGDQQAHKARFTWLVAAEDVDIGDDKDMGVTETADAKGVLAQQMRQNEVFARLLVTAQTSTLVALQGENKRLTEQNRWLQERDAARQIEHENVLTARQTRELQLEAHKTKQQNIQDLFFTVRGLIPVCVNHLAGKTVIPAGTTPDREMMRVFMESLTQDQFMQLNSVLNAGQMVAVATVWKQFADEEARRKQQQSMPPGSPPGQNPNPTPNGAH